MNHQRLPVGRCAVPLPIAAIAALLVCTKPLAGEDKPIPGKSFVIESSIREKISREPRSKILAESKVLVRENNATEFLNDGQIKLGAENSFSTVSLKVTAKSAAGNKIFVSGVMEVSAAAAPSSDIMVRESTAVHFAKTVASGERISFHLSESKQSARWFELQVVDANREAVPHVARGSMPSRRIR